MVINMLTDILGGSVRDYHGFRLTDFEFEGRHALVAEPEVSRKDRRFIWRAEFPGAFDTVDAEMLRRGYYLVYVQASDMYGCPEAVGIMKCFFDFLTEKLDFYKKTVLFGFSRGGLYSVNFALAYPEHTEVLYLDAPVLDIKSWPGGLGVGRGASREWEECLGMYGLDRSTVLSYKGNPADRLGELASLHIPVALVAGDSDADVPFAENGALLRDVYEAAGEKLLCIVKEGCAHHPHSLTDPAPVADFLESCAV